MSQNRRRFTPEVNAQIVRRHLSGKELISKRAEEFQIQPSQENEFDRTTGTDNGRRESSKDQRRIEFLEAR